eukprot:3509082-Alexandrium_andersonii.AAC.1
MRFVLVDAGNASSSVLLVAALSAQLVPRARQTRLFGLGGGWGRAVSGRRQARGPIGPRKS